MTRRTNTPRRAWQALLSGLLSFAGLQLVLGLFLDLEVRLIDGPVFVDQPYAIESEIVGLGESRRTESYWTRTTLTDVDRDVPVAVVLLHSGMFKESYPGYPAERLG